MTGTATTASNHIANEAEIRSMVQRYTDAASRRDAAGIARVFCTDCTWQSPAIGNFDGQEAITAFFAEMLNGFEAFIQALLSGVVVLDSADADRAQGRWFVHEIGQQSGGAVLDVSGVYHDEYRREAGTWRMSRRRYDPLLLRTDETTTALPYPVDLPEVEVD